jgi:hypothetical protein
LHINKDVAAGVFFMALGALGLVIGADYAFGTTARMGAGFVPKLLAWSVIGLGAIIVLTGAAAGGADRTEPWAFGPLVIILSAVLVFSALLERVGFEGAVVAAVLLAGSAQSRPSIPQMVLVVAAIAMLLVVLYPGMSRRIGSGIVDILMWSALAALLAHVARYAVGAPIRTLIETLLLAAALAVFCVVVFADLLGLPFKSLFVLDLWLPVKTTVFVPLFNLVRGLFRGHAGA